MWNWSIVEKMAPAINLFGMVVLSWTLAVGSGVLLCWPLLLVRVRRLGYPVVPVLVWVMLAFPVGTAGAVALNGLVLWLGATALQGGMTVLGAIVACAIFSVGYIRLVLRRSPSELLDAVSFTFPLATAIGRIGCLLNGCCFGVAAAPSWPHALTLRASDYVPPSLAAAFYAGADPALRVVDLPLLFILAELVVLIVVETLYRRRVGRPGFVFGVAVGLDALLRVGVETFRADAELGRSPWAAMALGVAILGLGFAASRLQTRPGQARQRP